jgi:hypothetical protein
MGRWGRVRLGVAAEHARPARAPPDGRRWASCSGCSRRAWTTGRFTRLRAGRRYLQRSRGRSLNGRVAAVLAFVCVRGRVTGAPDRRSPRQKRPRARRHLLDIAARRGAARPSGATTPTHVAAQPTSLADQARRSGWRAAHRAARPPRRSRSPRAAGDRVKASARRSPAAAIRHSARPRGRECPANSNFDHEIDPTMRELDECTESDERADAFCPIRGVGPYAVRPAIAEIGDITRFDLPACISPRREGT